MISSGHCCVYLFRILLGARGFPCGSLLFLSVSFRSRCFSASNRFVLLRDSLLQLVRKLGFGWLFAASFLFLFCFVYLVRTSLSSVFFFHSFSFCLFDPSVPQCRLSYEIYAVDSFHALVRSLWKLDLQCSTVRHHRSHFASSDTNYFELLLLVFVVFWAFWVSECFTPVYFSQVF